MEEHPVALRALAYFDALFSGIDEEENARLKNAQCKPRLVHSKDYQVVDIERQANTISNMSISPAGQAIDLFCGCGGISEGLKLAGYDVRAGVDIEEKYIRTFRHNFPDAHAITDSVLKISPDAFAESIGIEPEEPAILVGGPPCRHKSAVYPRGRENSGISRLF